jgi:hypothetical protein
MPYLTPPKEELQKAAVHLETAVNNVAVAAKMVVDELDAELDPKGTVPVRYVNRCISENGLREALAAWDKATKDFLHAHIEGFGLS